MSERTPIFYDHVSLMTNHEVAPNHFVLTFEHSKMASLAQPGQFVMIKPEKGSILLGRPYSIFRVDGSKLSFLYKIYGKGSREISRLKPGDSVYAWGPLGNGFRPTQTNEWLWVAGGVGVAPFLFLAQRSPKNIKMKLFFGIKTSDHAILKNEFEELGCSVTFVTEDGSLGEKGFVTDVLRKELNQGPRTTIELFTCGPRLMEAKVAQISRENHLRCQVAFEEYMGCGLGTCMGCVVECHDGKASYYKRVCREGPVFMADEMVW
ncbi:MAG: dihydroorotate dehydrogenase electron transfer subunit [Chlamydiae bacterium]|nr:dihydroorotate dehydrogenase electron transfer subunit [Chlamydiota bacterium]MBI3277853.1 dihydroorotate dehydrogenase electron transfer subunit [Chlamydiota bacterium]